MVGDGGVWPGDRAWSLLVLVRTGQRGPTDAERAEFGYEPSAEYHLTEPDSVREAEKLATRHAAPANGDSVGHDRSYVAIGERGASSVAFLA